jgi:hypothetical protein
MTQINIRAKWAREWWMTDSEGRPLPLMPGLIEQYSLSYRFRATRKRGSDRVHVGQVEKYPRALTSGGKVHKVKNIT